MSDESWPDKRQFKIYTEGKIPKTINILEKQRIKEVIKNNETLFNTYYRKTN